MSAELAKEVFHKALNDHQEVVEELDIVKASFSGMKPGLITGYLWHVLSPNAARKDTAQDPEFARLNASAAVAIEAARGYMPLRIAVVHPSNLAELYRKYEQAGFNMDPAIKSVAGATADNTPQPAPEDHLDTLIGGLEPYNDKVRKTREIAAQAKEVYGEGYAEAFRLDAFDVMEDPAAELLIDIALARNATIKGGLARGLEMLAEPMRVLEEITGNPYETNFGRITTLDITGAIESGALKVNTTL